MKAIVHSEKDGYDGLSLCEVEEKSPKAGEVRVKLKAAGLNHRDLTSMFGFPADYILCQEVSRSVGRTEEEQQMLLNELSPPMLIAGFTTVTVASVIIASVLVKTLH